MVDSERFSCWPSLCNLGGKLSMCFSYSTIFYSGSGSNRGSDSATINGGVTAGCYVSDRARGSGGGSGSYSGLQ